MCDCENVLRYCTHNVESEIVDHQVNRTVKLSNLVDDREARLVDEFRFALDDLDGVIEQLRVRTFPVSRPDYISVDCDAIDPAVLSDARYQLVRIHSLTGAVRGIIDRLEV